jgi:putative antitoxin of VapBC-like toxin-antitoxin system
MATSLDIDPFLVEEAVAVGGRRTKREAVTEAVQEYIARRRQAQATTLFGTVDYDPKYGHKKQRRRRP